MRLLASVTLLASMARAQSFDVAAVHEIKVAALAVPHYERLPGNREVRVTMKLGLLIRTVYNVPFNAFVIKDKEAADWITNTWWVVDAKCDQPFGETKMTAMLKSLLTERFKLQIQTEQKFETLYVLTVDPGGLKMQEHNEADTEFRPVIFEATKEGDMVISGKAVTIGQLLFSLPFWELQAHVADHTGLTGRYDIHWLLNQSAGATYALSPGNTMDTLKRQLGLRLQETKGMVDVINILHAEKPKEN
jgi:uncharacterized protein (TIGR03435 family)